MHSWQQLYRDNAKGTHCWVFTATMFIEFPRQHWLRERTSKLRYTYIDGNFSILKIIAKCVIIKTYISSELACKC
jgi:hypothetical protein